MGLARMSKAAAVPDDDVTALPLWRTIHECHQHTLEIFEQLGAAGALRVTDEADRRAVVDRLALCGQAIARLESMVAEQP
jgi:hypothetical protein